MARLLLVGASPFHLQAIAAAPLPGYDVAQVIVHTFLAEEVVSLFPSAKLTTVPMIHAAKGHAVDERFISALAPHEAETLLMLDRSNRWGASLMATRAYYLQVLGYCSHLLTTGEHDAVVFYNAPHQGFDFVLYGLARHMHIPIAIVVRTQLHERVMIKRYLEDAPVPARLPEVDPALLLKAAPSSYMREVVPLQRSTAYHSSRSKRLVPVSYSPSHLIRRMRRSVEAFPVGIPDQSVNGASRLALNIMARKNHARALLFYRSAPNATQEHGPIRLLSASTSTRSDNTTWGWIHARPSQLRPAARVCAARWVKTAIKEHPASFRFSEQICRARSTHFYADLSSLPNTDLIDSESDSDSLMDGCRFLATGSGTPGWEAVNRGRPVVVFGWPWYLAAPGVTRATAVDALRATFTDEGGQSGCPCSKNK